MHELRNTTVLQQSLRIAALAVLSYVIAVDTTFAAVDSQVAALINEGEFRQAEELLEKQISDAAAPITSDAAIQLEILRRTRQDFPLTEAVLLSELKKDINNVTAEDLARWRKDGDLQTRKIDGELRYFRNAIGNLFRFSADAKSRRTSKPKEEKKFDLDSHLEELVKLADASESPEVFPVEHRVRYELAVNKNNPRLKPGAKVRAWLPYPQEYRQQRDVKLISASPSHHTIAENGTPQRTIYFEDTVTSPAEPPQFVAEFEFVTSAYCPKLDPAKVQPYDTQSALYQEFTADRAPHIVFTPEVKQLAAEIVGDETNPLEKARRVFRWVSDNIPWCSEMEYSIIPSLSQKALAARRGDCGVQGTTFVTLCRAAGVPARWQSGWQTKPGDWNMHDWSEIYIEPWGWLPADASYGTRKHADPRIRDFLCGNMDPYRLIVNLDYGRELQPSKTSFRSEPIDFQRGEIEIDGHNLYFDEWDWTFDVKTKPLADKRAGGE